MGIKNVVLNHTLLFSAVFFGSTGCDAVKEAVNKANNRVWVCGERDTPALRASGSLQVQAGGKKFRVKVNNNAKLQIGPLVTRVDQPIACGDRSRSAGTSFSLLLHRKGKPALTIHMSGFDYLDLKKKKVGYTINLSGNVMVPGEDKARSFLMNSGAVEYLGDDRYKIKLAFNNFSAKLKGPGEKFPMSISGNIEIDLDQK